MKRFKKILYILDEVSLNRQGSADKVAELARLNDARVTVLIAEETKFFDDLSSKITGRYEELRQAALAHHRERLDGFLAHERWQDIHVIPDYSEADDFIAIIRKVISETYDLVKIYSDTVLRIIEEGIRDREIREDLEPKLIRLGIIGSIEQVCLSGIVFGREISPDDITEDLCELIFKGIERTQI